MNVTHADLKMNRTHFNCLPSWNSYFISERFVSHSFRFWFAYSKYLTIKTNRRKFDFGGVTVFKRDASEQVFFEVIFSVKLWKIILLSTLIRVLGLCKLNVITFQALIKVKQTLIGHCCKGLWTMLFFDHCLM